MRVARPPDRPEESVFNAEIRDRNQIVCRADRGEPLGDYSERDAMRDIRPQSRILNDAQDRLNPKGVAPTSVSQIGGVSDI
jgi:hypothetical protein